MSSTRRRLLKNFLSLNGLQIANYIFPLIALPYLVRVIGPEKYGIISFAQAVIAYFTLCVLYSFDLSATREISARRDDVTFVSQLFSTVITTRFLIFLATSIPLALVLMFVPKFSAQKEVYLILFGINLGYTLFPTFYFQGIERLSRIAFFNVVIKFIFTVGIFLFVRKESDYLYVPLSLTVGHITAGLLAFSYALASGPVKFVVVPLKNIVALLKGGFKLFVSSIVINLYTTTNTVLLGLLAGDVAVGYFAAAEKLEAIIQNLTLNPLSQILYPFLGKTLHDDKRKGIALLEQAFVWITAITAVLSLGIMLFAPLLVRIVYGKQFMGAVPVLYFLAWLLFLRGASNVCGIQGLLNLKMDREFLMITSIGMVLSLTLNFIFIPSFGEIGAAACWIGIEIYTAIAMFTALRRANAMSLTPKKIKTILSTVPHV